MNADKPSTAESEAHDLLFNTRRSARYHMRREAFYDGWNKATSAVAVIFGSAAVGALISDLNNHLAIYAAATVAVFSAIDLVAGTAAKARLHNDLRRRFLDIEQKIAGSDATATKVLKADYLKIEADEPPVLRALDTICYNDLLQADGYSPDDGHYVKLRWYERWTSHFINWPVSTH